MSNLFPDSDLGTGREQLPDLASGMMSVFCPEGCISEGEMVGYAPGVERLMKRLFDSLKESDRRR
jgi:hypothetical protein